jgi:MFS family permease
MNNIYLRLLWPIYFPSLMSSISYSAGMILLPLYLLDAGYSVATVSFVVATWGSGSLLADVPAGLFANRYGDKPAMILGGAALVTGVLLLVISAALVAVVLSALLLGMSMAFSLVGRLSYITDSCGMAERGRVIAVMAGLQRAGALLGPVIFSLVAKQAGYQIAFCIMAVLITSGLLLVILFAGHFAASHRKAVPLSGMLRIMVEFRHILLTAGFAGLGLMMLRASRILLFPLVGHSAGLDVAQIGLLFSCSSALDMLMFYPAGQIMDNRGRKWTAVPGMLLLVSALGILVLMPSGAGLIIFAIISGLGNGITTGVLLTIGSDLAPEAERNHFIGLWRLQLDAGNALAPFLVGTMADMLGLALAILTIMGIGLAGAGVLAFCVRETLVKERQV